MSINSTTDRATSRLKSPIRLGPDGLLAEAGGFSINLRTPKSPTKEAMKGLIGKGMAKLGKCRAELNNTWLLSEQWGVSCGQGRI